MAAGIPHLLFPLCLNSVNCSIQMSMELHKVFLIEEAVCASWNSLGMAKLPFSGQQ
jgi:hypothetical protein